MRDPLALRGRVLLVFQDKWRDQVNSHTQRIEFHIVPWAISVAEIARELGVSRQAVYRACPELISRNAAQ